MNWFILRDATTSFAHLRCFHMSFPLTPTLSLGEREPRRPAPGQSDALRLIDRLARFPLSLRERVGVRGKGPYIFSTPPLFRELSKCSIAALNSQLSLCSAKV